MVTKKPSPKSLPKGRRGPQKAGDLRRIAAKLKVRYGVFLSTAVAMEEMHCDDGLMIDGQTKPDRAIVLLDEFLSNAEATINRVRRQKEDEKEDARE